jgi:hypothetical protein
MFMPSPDGEEVLIGTSICNERGKKVNRWRGKKRCAEKMIWKKQGPRRLAR